MMTDAYARAHGWAVLLTGGGVNLAYRGPLWAPYATAHCAPSARITLSSATPLLTSAGVA